MRVSVLTLVRGREDRLRRLVEGLARGDRHPDELVIARMQEHEPRDLASLPFPVRTLFVPGEELPLAAARNGAAAAASGDGLVFLDVDCIPSRRLVARYAAVLAGGDPGLLLGEVRYLPAALPEQLDDAVLSQLALPHPARPAVPADGLLPEPDHGQLWGLSFALRRAIWERIGGMDERYRGYGGEETDLAARLAEHGVPAWWVGGAVAFHQHHPVRFPPLQHFGSIVRNAALFRARHKRWCMEYWLDGFEAIGLIRRDGERITVLREPQAEELAGALLPPEARWG